MTRDEEEQLLYTFDHVQWRWQFFKLPFYDVEVFFANMVSNTYVSKHFKLI